MDRVWNFTADEWVAITGCFVYLAWEGDKVLYIGMTTRGITRPSHPMHAAAEAIKRATRMELRSCRSVYEARSMEKELIQKFQPQYNTIYTERYVSTIKPGLGNPRRISLMERLKTLPRPVDPLNQEQMAAYKKAEEMAQKPRILR